MSLAPMDARRPASISSYFAHSQPSTRSYRLLLRVYAAEGLQHVAATHGTYCKVYVGHTEMLHGSSSFARRTQQLTSSASSHSLAGLLHSSFGSSSSTGSSSSLNSSGSGSSRSMNSNRTHLSSSSHSSSSSNNNCSSRSLLAASGHHVGNQRLDTTTTSVRKTQTRKTTRAQPLVWNERFDIPVENFDQDVLSIRVKTARLMASSAIGACSLSLKHVVTLGAPTLDRWVDLKRGTKYAGRIRLQLRLVDASTSSGQDSNVPDTCRSQDRDTHLSVPGEETLEDIAARSRKSSRRGHKYHRSARRFDGRPLTNTALASSCSTNSSSSSSSRRSSSSRLASDKDNSLKRVSTPRRSLRNHSSSATSSESIDDDSNPASDESASPIVSPRRERSSSEDGSVFCDVDSSFAMDRRAAKGPTLSPLVTPGAMESYTRMRRSELEYSKAKIANVSREPRTVKLPENGQRHLREDDDDDLDECVYRCSSNMSSIDNCTKSSVLSSIFDSRESSRMDFDDDDDGWGPVSTTKESLKHRSGSTALSSVASSIFDPRDSSRVSFGDSESGDEESDDVKLEKAHEQRRQQWRMEQQKKQLAAIEERPYSMSDDESDQEGDEHDGLELDSSRMQFTPTIATLLTRESNNVLMDEEDDEEGPESHKLSEEFVPILEASSPMSVDFVDSALRLSSCSS